MADRLGPVGVGAKTAKNQSSPMAIRKYNPAFLSADELVKTFCVRSRELRSISETIRACSSTSNVHMLVVGPRGSGKTTLLLRVATEVRRDHDLSRRFFPIVFAEESYNVSTCGEFWLEVFYRLAQELRRGVGGADYGRLYDEFRKISDEPTLTNRCLGELLRFARQEGKRLVLFVENVNSIFANAKSTDMGWQLRHTLQTEPQILLIASATNRFDAIDDPSEALFGFFQVRRLKPLNEHEAADLWESASGFRPKRPTIRSIQILTGGSPRLISIIAQFGAGLSFADLMNNLMALVDDHTEYFRSNLEALPFQERLVFLALAGLWKPSTTREIADQARLTTNQCSGQLKRLEERGAVLVTGGSPRRKQYYLTERLFNIYYLLRLHGGAGDLVHALVRFMQAYYSLPQLVEVAAQIAQATKSQDAITSQIARQTLALLTEAAPHNVRELFPALPELGGPDDSAQIAVRESPSPAGTGTSPRELAAEATQFYRNREFAAAIRKCDEILIRFGTNTDPAVLAQVGETLLRKGAALLKLDQVEHAIEVFDDVERRLSHYNFDEALEKRAQALFFKGMVFDENSLPSEALDTFESVLHRFSTVNTAQTQICTASAHFNRGVILARANRIEEAVQEYAALAKNFGRHTNSAILTWVAKGLVNKAVLLAEQRRVVAALDAYGALNDLALDPNTPAHEECVNRALAGRASALQSCDRSAEAIAAIDELCDRLDHQSPPAGSGAVARALLARAELLARSGAADKALLAYDALQLRFADDPGPDVVDSVASGLVNKGITLFRLDDRVAALEILAAAEDHLVRNAAEQSPLLETVLLYKAMIQLAIGNFADAIAAATRIVERDQSDKHHNRLLALFVRAFSLASNRQRELAEADIASALTLLPSCESSLGKSVDWLINLTTQLGPGRLLELIKGSPAAGMLLPLATALELELGLAPRVAVEVQEVAADIQHCLAEVRGDAAG